MEVVVKKITSFTLDDEVLCLLWEMSLEQYVTEYCGTDEVSFEAY